jgi:hypothetical protein
VSAPIVVPGAVPLVLVAPHGGRRDPAQRPWSAGGLRTNDLHTADLTAQLARATGGAAVINEGTDRNDVDLNRVSDADARAPEFLEALAQLVDEAVARHGQATVLTVHGWNVIQPAVDLGLGCAPGAEPCTVSARAAVSAAFASAAVPSLAAACAARGIAVTVGARYPARHRENLLQLFTPRYHDDPRPRVRRLAAHAAAVNALQLELGIPLRWPGDWRDRLLDACSAVLPVLLGATRGAEPASGVPAATPAGSRPPLRLEFTSPALAGLVGVEPERARLLLFPGGDELLLFTGERTVETEGRVGGLSVRPRAGGGYLVEFRGPLLRFPDTTPFLDLEHGLAAARLAEADVKLAFVPDASGRFGTISGSVVVDGRHLPLAGGGFCEEGMPAGPWPRLRAAFRLGTRGALVLTLGLDGGQASGVLHRGALAVPVAGARATPDDPSDPLAGMTLEVELADGERLTLRADAVVRLPVVRARGQVAIRVDFAACRVDGESIPAGWCEIGGLR